mmetsp:Transcript_12600/g.45310  ORF Transcript_12600/g.45310 Transcript_12600/m.45310 type:complete len:251 (-) Transcript_12600:34-786(-)
MRDRDAPPRRSPDARAVESLLERRRAARGGGARAVAPVAPRIAVALARRAGDRDGVLVRVHVQLRPLRAVRAVPHDARFGAPRVVDVRPRRRDVRHEPVGREGRAVGVAPRARPGRRRVLPDRFPMVRVRVGRRARGVDGGDADTTGLGQGVAEMADHGRVRDVRGVRRRRVDRVRVGGREVGARRQRGVRLGRRELLRATRARRRRRQPREGEEAETEREAGEEAEGEGDVDCLAVECRRESSSRRRRL